MPEHISFPSIDQMRNVVKSVRDHSQYIGKDENGDAIYDRTLSQPKIVFTGTVKLHGTNASVCLNPQGEFWAQSRENVITLTKDNAGFAFFAEKNKSNFLNLIGALIEKGETWEPQTTISIFGEWVGKGIQRGVAIAEIEKAFFIFGVKISRPEDKDFVSYWLDCRGLRNEDARIFNVYDYDKYAIEIDFDNPGLVQNKLGEITEKVEAECPIAKAFGISGVGEGVVWTANYKGNNYRFKVKGEKHSVSKVKTLASVDVEKLESINAFVEYAVTPSRFDQAVTTIFGEGELDIKKMGDLIRWVVNDIVKEEIDTLAENGLEPKEVNSKISEATRKMFFALYNNPEENNVS